MLLSSTLKYKIIFIILYLQFNCCELAQSYDRDDGFCEKEEIVLNLRKIFGGVRYATEKVRVCCEGYEKFDDTKCTPICHNECPENSYCSSPDMCACNEGYEDFGEGCREIWDIEFPENSFCPTPDTCMCNRGYEDLGEGCKPICEDVSCKKNAFCAAPNTCKCVAGFTINNEISLDCIPFCNDLPDNAECIAPDKWRCKEGYEKSDIGICKPICDTACEKHTYCQSPNFCWCKKGYMRNYIKNICEPICWNECQWPLECVAPDTCGCGEGYELININSHEPYCRPICEQDCSDYGLCIAPNVCECGYSLEGFKTCVNGTCDPSGKCKCWENYASESGETISEKSLICIPIHSKKNSFLEIRNFNVEETTTKFPTTENYYDTETTLSLTTRNYYQPTSSLITENYDEITTTTSLTTINYYDTETTPTFPTTENYDDEESKTSSLITGNYDEIKTTSSLTTENNNNEEKTSSSLTAENNNNEETTSVSLTTENYVEEITPTFPTTENYYDEKSKPSSLITGKYDEKTTTKSLTTVNYYEETRTTSPKKRYYYVEERNLLKLHCTEACMCWINKMSHDRICLNICQNSTESRNNNSCLELNNCICNKEDDSLSCQTDGHTTNYYCSSKDNLSESSSANLLESSDANYFVQGNIYMLLTVLFVLYKF